MRKVLSLVIPTYNMQEYLHRCLTSLIVSQDKLDLYEVLVINDGSKDDSLFIAQGFKTKYPNTFRVIDKENGNYGSCVNRGLLEAQGKYIKILDADDWFDTVAFSAYLDLLQTVDVDLVLTPYCIHNEYDGSVRTIRQRLPENKSFEFDSFPKESIFRYSMHMVTYQTDLLRHNHYFQTEGISYTDTEWTHIPQYYIKDFVYFPTPVYQYMLGREGQTMDSSILARDIWKYEVICKSLITNRNKFNRNKVYSLADELNIQQIHFLASCVYRILLIRSNSSKEDIDHLKEFDNYLLEQCRQVYKSTDELLLKKKLPIRYIHLWRSSGYRFPFLFFRKLYQVIKRGNV